MPVLSARRLRHASLFWGALLVLLINLATLPVKAVQPEEVLQDPALEARARHISEGLRCLVCQNQSIDDSEAPLAKDLRLLVRERLKAGDTDQQIEDFVVARYGEFVLLKPRFTAHTLLLSVRHARGAPRCPADRGSGVSAAGGRSFASLRAQRGRGAQTQEPS
jgi:cytochrome c-type biogenesis protein CcmH/NrfF